MNSPDKTDAQQGNFVKANGLNIHYAEYGKGEALILLHGGTANRESWQAQIPIFEPHFRVIALDTRGHGKTDNPDGELSYSVLADDVAAFIQTLGLKRPQVFGYSDGGQIALELGIRYPDLSGALVLGGTVYKFAQAYFDFLKGMGIERAGVVNVEAMEQSDASWVDYLKAAHPRDDDPDYWQKLMKQISTLWWTPPIYTPEDLQKISAPTLILVGDRDVGIELWQTLEMYQHIAKAEMAIMPNADHGTTINDLSIAIVLDFLLRHRGLSEPQ